MKKVKRLIQTGCPLLTMSEEMSETERALEVERPPLLFLVKE